MGASLKLLGGEQAHIFEQKPNVPRTLPQLMCSVALHKKHKQLFFILK